jgi:hypothetical protein
MAGLVQTATNPQSSPPPSAAPVQINPTAADISDPILQKIVAGVRAKIPDQLKTPYMQVLVAGKKVMFSPQTSRMMMQRLNAPGSLIHNVASGIADLMTVIYKESNRQMSLPAAMLACIELMCEALDVAEKTTGVQMTTAIAAACAHATSMAVLQKFGIGPGAIEQSVAAGRQVVQQKKAGIGA